MAYQKQTWRNLPDRTTPITAARLEHMETQYDEAIAEVDPDSIRSTLSLKADKSYVDDAVFQLETKEGLEPQLDPRLAASFSQDRCVIVFTGSSTTSIGEYPRFLTSRIQSQWAGGPFLTLAQAISPEYPIAGVAGVNAGASGQGAATYLGSGRAASISSLNPSIVFHGVGAGDWKSGVSPEQYKLDLESAISSITSSNPLIHIIVHQHERLDVPSSNPNTWDDFRRAAEEVAGEEPNRIFVDASEYMRLAGVGVGLDNRYGLLSSDNVHLTYHGHSVLASVVAERLGIGGVNSSGWEDISSYLTSGTSVHSQGYVRAKRSGDLVSLDLTRVLATFPAGDTVDILSDLPDKFTPFGGSGHANGPVWSAGGEGIALVRGHNNTVGIKMRTASSEIRSRFSFGV